MESSGQAHRLPFDVIVVGAGPAGCAAAIGLPADFRVLVVDMAGDADTKACGGLLSPEAWRLLQQFNAPLSLLEAPGKLAFRYYDTDRLVCREFDLHLYNASRPRLSAWLASLLPERIEFWRETTLLGFRDYGTHVEIELRRGPEHMTVMTRYLIGADGASSLVRRQLTTDPLQYYRVFQDTIKPEKPLPPYFDFVFSSKGAPGFLFSYLIPKGRYAVIGSVFNPGAESGLGVHEHMKRALRDKTGAFSRLSRRELGAVMRLRSVNDVFLGRGRILLAGEAAGLVSPAPGHGISYALHSGEACGMAFWGEQNPLESYEQLAEPILDDIRSKLGKLHFLEGRFGQSMASRMPVRVLSWMGKQLFTADIRVA